MQPRGGYSEALRHLIPGTEAILAACSYPMPIPQASLTPCHHAQDRMPGQRITAPLPGGPDSVNQLAGARQQIRRSVPITVDGCPQIAEALGAAVFPQIIQTLTHGVAV